MKNIFFLMCVTACSVACSQSPFYVGSNVKYWTRQDKSGSNNKGKTTTWEFSPEIGYGINKHIQVAAILNFEGSKWKSQTTLKEESRYGVSAYVRYMFGEAAFKPFVGVNAGFSTGSYKRPYFDWRDRIITLEPITEEGKLSGYHVNIFAGFGYTLHPRWTVIGSFGLLGIDKITKTPNPGSKGKTSSTTNSGLDIGTLGQRFSVGLYYTL